MAADRRERLLAASSGDAAHAARVEELLAHRNGPVHLGVGCCTGVVYELRLPEVRCPCCGAPLKLLPEAPSR